MSYLAIVAVGLAILVAIAIEKRRQDRLAADAVDRRRVLVAVVPGVVECLQSGCGEIAAGDDVLGWALHHTRTTGHPTSAHQPI